MGHTGSVASSQHRTMLYNMGHTGSVASSQHRTMWYNMGHPDEKSISQSIYSLTLSMHNKINSWFFYLFQTNLFLPTPIIGYFICKHAGFVLIIFGVCATRRRGGRVISQSYCQYVFHVIDQFFLTFSPILNRPLPYYHIIPNKGIWFVWGYMTPFRFNHPVMQQILQSNPLCKYHRF